MTDIRVMTIDYYDDIYELWEKSGENGINTTDDSREGISKYLKRNPKTSFVALDNGKLIGMIMAGHDGRRGFIHHMLVSAEYRGQGIGRRLVESAMKALDDEGINKVALVAYTNNDNGNKFWERMGFNLRDDIFYRNKAIHKLEYKPNKFQPERVEDLKKFK
ncbi:MAG: GNAT family N-acetyltransferase [Ruminococcus sp.]|nr:GNAT family N-acetyltransferase [Ruminococcus sp.]